MRFEGTPPPERYDPLYMRRLIIELQQAINNMNASNLMFFSPLFDIVTASRYRFTQNDDIGSITWNEDDRTLDVKLSNSVTANIPTEQLAPRCVNKTGVDIPDGTPVYISGVQGQRLTITPASASSYATSSKIIGVTTEDIPNNNEGFVTRAGYVRDIDTSSFVAGDCVYLSPTTGEFTTTKPNPADGESPILMGMVIQAHATEGILCVNIHQLSEWFGNLDGGNYFYFDSNGVGVAKGSGRLYEDLQFSISTGKVPASNAPTYETFTTNTRAYSFDVNDYIDLETNEPFHGTDFTTTATFHAHVTTKTANSSGSSQYVKVQITCAYCSADSTWTEFTATGELEIPNGTPALYKQIVAINSSSLDLADVELGGQITPVLKRITATGGTEYADNVFITQVGLHIRCDQAGSRDVFTK